MMSNCLYSISISDASIKDYFGWSRRIMETAVDELIDSDVCCVVRGGNRKPTKYYMSFKIVGGKIEDGKLKGGDVEMAKICRDESKILGLFDNSSYISCDDIPAPKKKKKMTKKKTISELDPTKAEVFDPEMLKEFIEKRFKDADIKPKFPLNKKKLDTALKEMCELSGDDIRLLIDCVTSDSYQPAESWEGGKSFTLFVGGALERTLAAAKKWEKSREKQVKTKEKLKEVKLKLEEIGL